MNPRKLLEITNAELAFLKNAIKAHPDKKVFHTYEFPELTHTLYRFKDSFVFEGSLLGSGNWGTTHLCIKVQVDTMVQSTCVIKKPRAGYFHEIKNIFSGVSEKMKTEAEINNKIYGDSAWIALDNRRTIIILPFLGDSTLADVLSDISLLSKTPLRMWASFFIQLSKNLYFIHRYTGLINNDIKPENILLLFAKNSDGTLSYPLNIISANIIDWGNAHAKGVLHLPGDMRYAGPFEWYAKKEYQNEKIDIYSLGKTFLYVLKKFMEHPFTNQNEIIFKHYNDLFNSMTSLNQAAIPQLLGTDLTSGTHGIGVIETLSAIEMEYDFFHRKFPSVTQQFNMFPAALMSQDLNSENKQTNGQRL